MSQRFLAPAACSLHVQLVCTSTLTIISTGPSSQSGSSGTKGSSTAAQDASADLKSKASYMSAVLELDLVPEACSKSKQQQKGQPAQQEDVESNGEEHLVHATVTTKRAASLHHQPAEVDLKFETGSFADDGTGPAPNTTFASSNSSQQQDPAIKPFSLHNPKVWLDIHNTYVVGNFTWLLSSVVAPEKLQIYQNSTAAAHYTITVLRVPLEPTQPLLRIIDGIITVTNNHWQPIDIASIAAVLPWGRAALCQPEPDFPLPGRLDPGVKISCRYRVEYELGDKPSSLRAHLNLVGNPQPLKSWARSFRFDKPDWSLSPGACARLSTAFDADTDKVSVNMVAGEAPGSGGTFLDVCDDYAKFEFGVLVTPFGMSSQPFTVGGAGPGRRCGSCGCQQHARGAVGLIMQGAGSHRGERRGSVSYMQTVQ